MCHWCSLALPKIVSWDNAWTNSLIIVFLNCKLRFIFFYCFSLTELIWFERGNRIFQFDHISIWISQVSWRLSIYDFNLNFWRCRTTLFAIDILNNYNTIAPLDKSLRRWFWCPWFKNTQFWFIFKISIYLWWFWFI